MFTLSAALLGALLLEVLSFVGVRILAEQPDVIRSETHLFDAHRNHRLNPVFQLSEAARDKLHSDDGFRHSRPLELQKPSGTVRVLVLGTSALYGIGSRAPYPERPALANDETITYHLERFLNQRLQAESHAVQVEVINAGVSAYHTFHHLIYLNSALLAYQPDVVVNLDGHNDFYAETLEDRWNQYAYSTSILIDQYNGRTFYMSALTTTRALAPYSNFFNLVERLFRRSWYRKVDQPLIHTPSRPVQRSPLSAMDVARQSYLLDLWQIHRLGEYAGYHHCVFLQPEILLEQESHLSPADQELRRITVQHTTPNRSERMQAIRAQLPALFEEYTIPFHDIGELAGENSQDRDLYIDYCHLTPAGAELVAQRMLDVVYALVVAE